MAAQFSTLGALIGLAIAIVLIIRKVAPAYCLILGALVGGLIGGGGLAGTVSTMVSGAGSMMSSVLRILTSGILAGALIKTGSAQKIAEAIVDKLGQKRAIMAISIATMIICAVGVFIDISVITVAPIALAIGEKAGLSKSGVLLAMIGGGKAGNIVSPNPNTIAVSEAFEQPLTSVTAAPGLSARDPRPCRRDCAAGPAPHLRRQHRSPDRPARWRHRERARHRQRKESGCLHRVWSQ